MQRTQDPGQSLLLSRVTTSPVWPPDGQARSCTLFDATVAAGSSSGVCAKSPAPALHPSSHLVLMGLRHGYQWGYDSACDRGSEEAVSGRAELTRADRWTGRQRPGGREWETLAMLRTLDQLGLWSHSVGDKAIAVKECKPQRIPSRLGGMTDDQ